MTTLLTLEIHYEQDVVQTRQCTRQIAELLGFDAQDQTRIATAVSEIARNAFQYAAGGRVEFWVDEPPQHVWIRIQDQGRGIVDLEAVLDGRYTSQTGLGLGILGTRRLMDQFQIESIANGTIVTLAKAFPQRSLALTQAQLLQIRTQIQQRSPQNPFEEIQRQNQELLRAMAELRRREEELTQLNRELEDTNRGVVALYAELDEKAVSLQKANELKTRFLANMSHEFRTPVNSIISLSRILLDRMDGDLTPEQDKQIGLIQRSATDLSELVNDLLDLAKVEAGKIVVRPSSFEVSDLFGTLRGMLRPLLAHNSSVALLFEDAALPTLHTDEGKVAQILRNFISNALKFTDRGQVHISARLNQSTVTFAVADTGIGIAPEDQERIFEDFTQIDSPLQRQVKGTGLGLPLSRKLAELLGGSVSVSSALGHGSTFFATIPIAYPDAVVPDQPPAIDVTRAPVLVVEDNPETLLIYEKFLQNTVYQSVPAPSIAQAQQILQTLQPVAIVLDILLQNQHTWSFLTELKQTQPALPILVATVVNNEKQAIARGADGFLIKPVDRWLLLSKLNKVVKQHQPQTLLLIDDTLAARYVVKQLLAHTPLTILEAADGLTGLHLAQTELPDVIVLDLSMPDLTGAEVLEQLQQPPTRSLPVIIHTSSPLDPDEAAALAQHSITILYKGAAEFDVQFRQALLQAGIAWSQEAIDG